MTKLEQLTEMYPDIEFLKADGFDDAIIGAAEIKQIGEYVLVYSKTQVIKILMERDNMEFETAEEYYDFNIAGAFVGEKTPIWVDDEFFD